MKYIILEENGIEMALVFDELLGHSSVAAGKKVVSAGFASNGDAGWFAWGTSVSLRVSSRPEDAEVIKRSLGRKL